MSYQILDFDDVELIKLPPIELRVQCSRHPDIIPHSERKFSQKAIPMTGADPEKRGKCPFIGKFLDPLLGMRTDIFETRVRLGF